MPSCLADTAFCPCQRVIRVEPPSRSAVSTAPCPTDCGPAPDPSSCSSLHEKAAGGSSRRVGRRRANRRSTQLRARRSKRPGWSARSTSAPSARSPIEKRLKSGAVVVCDVRVFPLEVRHQSKRWPEKQERVIRWLSASQAAEKVEEPMLRRIIGRLARKICGGQCRLNDCCHSVT